MSTAVQEQFKIELRPQPAQEKFLSTPADIAIFGGAAGGGKALWTETPIPTPHGMRRMGDLETGREVLDWKGQPTLIEQAHPIQYDRPCYRLFFDDHSTLVADEEHLWTTNYGLLSSGELHRLLFRKRVLWIPLYEGGKRFIYRCHPTTSVPVRCIKVAAEDGLFLAGESRIPTHNTWTLLFEALRHVNNPQFTCVMFRRTYPEVTALGGLWAESTKAYPYFGARPNNTDLSWKFPAGAVVKFSHLQFDTDVRKYLGAQIALIGFDQVETFTEYQFFYMLSRNRTMCGIRPYIRATANPEPGWLADFLAWWIDPQSGFPILERSGKLRWMVREEDKIFWADSWQELHEQYPTKVLPVGVPPTADDSRTTPKSVTFIPAKLEDNKILMKADPGYMANLQAQPFIEQQRLLHGNWKVSSVDGEWPAEYFGSDLWYENLPREQHLLCSVLACDPSKGAKPSENKFGDYCAYVLIRVDAQWNVWADAWLDRWTSTQIIEQGLALVKEHNPTAVVFEINQFQELLAGDFARLSMERGIYPRVYGVTNMEPKPVRIRRIGPFLAQRRLKLKGDSPGARLLEQQLRQFGPNDGTYHDDGPDALEIALRGAEYLINGPGSGPGQLEAIEELPR